MTKKELANLVIRRLYDPKRPLTGLKHWKEPWQFLFCVILSAQSNDNQINKVSPTLFLKFPTLQSFVDATIKELEKNLKTIGLFRSKARYLHGSAAKLLNKHNGNVPSTLDKLLELPGVGRKTANVYQGVILKKSEGVAVDTHVSRTSRRLGLTKQIKVEKLEKDLMRLLPKTKYHLVNAVLFWHGREVCLARGPKCTGCKLSDICPSTKI